MPRITVDLSTEEIKDLVLQLPAQEFLVLVEAIEERAETIAMMRLCETAFQEWNEEYEADLRSDRGRPVHPIP